MSTATPADRSFLVDAFIGAVVTVLVAFLPFSPVVGGAVAGYLHRRDGLRVGAASGLIAAVPAFAIFAVVLSVLSVGFAFFEVPAFPLAILAFLGVFALAFIALTSTALGALGGFIGEELADQA